METPLVSILIPAHNCGRWLGAAIESALGQTWPHKEVIVVENNSSDDTLEVARRFEASGVQVFQSRDRGAAAARNLAFNASRGSMIQYLDGDDLLSPKKIAAQMADMDLEDRQISLSALCDFFDGDDPYSAPVHRGWPFIPGNNPRTWLAQLLGADGRSGFVALHQWLTPRALIDASGPWNERLTVNDDGEFFCRVLLQAREIRTSLEEVAYYRRHRSQSSLSSGYTRSQKHLESMLEALNLISDNLLREEPSTKLKSALARHYFEVALHAYPRNPQLSQKAQCRARELDASVPPPSATSQAGVRLRRCFGWKVERRIAYAYRWLKDKFPIPSRLH